MIPTTESIQQPGVLFTLLCDMATQQDWDRSKEIAEALANVGAQGIWLELAFDLADGLREIYKADANIFSLDTPLSQNQTQSIKDAQRWVSQQLGIPTPTLVIEVAPKDTPMHAITGISGFGFIIANAIDINIPSLLVHEITHCSLMSRSLFLDEGLATYMEHLFENKKVHIEKEYWDRPSIAAMIETDWSHDPYFTHIVPVEANFSEPIDSDSRVHRLAAYVVGLFIEKKGMPYVISQWKKIKPQLKDGKAHQVIKELFDIDVWNIDIELQVNFCENMPIHQLNLALPTKALAEGNRSLVEPYLSPLRIHALYDTKVLVALTRLLILFGINGKDENTQKYYRTEALASMNLAKLNQCDEKTLRFFEVYTYVFKLRGTGHAINLRKIGTQTSIAFEKLLKDYPNDPEVIITCARAQLKTYYDMLQKKEWNTKLKEIQQNNSLFSEAASQLLVKSEFSI